MMMVDSGTVPVARRVAQHGHLADRPQLQERRARARVAKVDDDRLERRLVLVERDQHLPAEGRQGMEVQRERHRFSLSSSSRPASIVKYLLKYSPAIVEVNA